MGCERSTAESCGEEEDDEAEADDGELVAAEADEDEFPVAACLDHFRLSRGAERDLNRRRSVDAYRHDRGESISKHARLPPIRIQLDVPRALKVSP